MISRSTFKLLVLAATGFFTPLYAAWPEKPITIVAGASPGGTTDILARVIATPLSLALGQSVLVENKPGAGGNIGTDYVAKAKPDGYPTSLQLNRAMQSTQ